MSRQLSFVDVTAPARIHSQLHLQRARHHLSEVMLSLNSVSADHLPAASARVITEAYTVLLDQINLLHSQVTTIPSLSRSFEVLS